MRIVDLTHPFAERDARVPGPTTARERCNVADLTELPARAQVVVAPIKLARGNGGPARIFALLPDEHNGP